MLKQKKNSDEQNCREKQKLTEKEIRLILEKERRKLEIQKGEIAAYITEDFSQRLPFELDYFIKTRFAKFLLIMGRFLFRIEILVNLFIALLVNIYVEDIHDDERPFTHWIILAYSVIYVIKEFVYISQLSKNVHQHNNQYCFRVLFNREKSFEKIHWKALLPGHLLLLKRNEVSPADILILDMRDNSCFTKESSLRSLDEYFEKRPLKLTAVDGSSKLKGDFSLYSQFLSGKIEYTPPNANLDSIYGRVSLTKDPKEEVFDKKNVILEGSLIFNTDWVLGIVLFCGEETKKLQMFKKMKEGYQKTFFHKFINVYSTILLIFSISLALIYLIVQVGNDVPCPLQDLICKSTNKKSIFFEFLNVFSFFLPSNLLLNYDLYDILVHFQLTRWAKENSTKILRTSGFPSLYTATSVLISNKAITMPNSQRVRAIFTESNLFEVVRNKEGTDEIIEEREGKFEPELSKPSNLNQIGSPISFNKKKHSEEIMIQSLLGREIIEASPTNFSGALRKSQKKDYFTKRMNIERKDLVRGFTDAFKILNQDESKLESSSDGKIKVFSSKENGQPNKETESLISECDDYSQRSDSLLKVGLIQRDSYYFLPPIKQYSVFTPKYSVNARPDQKYLVQNDEGTEYETISRNPTSDKALSESMTHSQNKRLIKLQKLPKQRSQTQAERQFVIEMEEKLSKISLQSKEFNLDSENSQKSVANLKDDTVADKNISNSLFDGGSYIKAFQRPRQLRNVSGLVKSRLLSGELGDKTEKGSKSEANQSRAQEEVPANSSNINPNLLTNNLFIPLNNVEEANTRKLKEQNFDNNSPEFQNANDMEVLKAIALCHSTRTKECLQDKFDDEQRFIQESSGLMDGLLLEFSSRHEYKFLGNVKIGDARFYKIKIPEETLFYEIKGINDYMKERKRFSILLKGDKQAVDPLEPPYLMYIRGHDTSFLDILNMDEGEKTQLAELLETVSKSGMNFMLYAKKDVNEFDFQEYQKGYQVCKRSVSCNSEELWKLYNAIEQKADLLAIVCFEQELRKNTVLVLDYLKKAKLKLCLLSEDGEKETIALAHLSHILEPFSTVFVIKFNSEEAGVLIVKSILQRMKRIIMGENIEKEQKGGRVINSKIMNLHSPNKRKSKKISDAWQDYSIVIDGNCFDIIKSSKYLNDHFKFLANFSKNLIAYNLNASRKAQFKSIFLQRKGDCRTFSLVNSLGDVPLAQSSDFIFQINSKSENVPAYGDIELFSLENIPQLVLASGRKITWRIAFLLNITIYVHIIAGVCSFFYTFYSNSSSKSLFSKYQFMIIAYLEIPILLSAYSFFGQSKRTYYNSLVDCFPDLHEAGKRMKMQYIKECFYNPLLISLKDSLIIFSFSMTSAQGLDDEKTDDLDSITIVLGLAIAVYSQFVFHFRSSVTTDVLNFIIISVCFSLLILIDKTQDQTFTFYPSIIQLGFVFQSSSQLLALALMIPLILSTNHIIIKHIKSNRDKRYQHILALLNKNISLRNLVIQINNIRGNYRSFRSFLSISEGIRKAARQIFNRNEMDNIIKDIVNPSGVSLSKSSLNNSLLYFQGELIEEKYRFKYIELHKNRDFLVLLVLVLAHIINTVENSGLKNKSKNDVDTLLNYGMISIHSIYLILILKSPSFSLKTLKLFYFFVMFTLLVILEGVIQAIICSENSHFLNSVLFMYSLLQTSFNLKNWMVNSFFGIVATNILAFYMIKSSNIYITPTDSQSTQLSETYTYLFIIYYFLALSVSHVWMNIRLEKKLREEFIAEDALEVQTRRVNEILSILVPKFVKELMQRDIFTLSEVHNNTAILFCDICNFDEIVAALGENIVPALDKIYRNFDQLCIHHEIQKIETVGKTYMASAGLQACEFDFELQGKNQISHPKRILSLAFDMMSSVKEYYWGDGNPFILKIGLHLGTVLAGVIGYHKPQFSLIGDTVNTASRVCSTGGDGKITISEVFHSAVKDEERYQFIKKEVEAKGKGVLINYQVDLAELFVGSSYSLLNKNQKIMTSLNIGSQDEICVENYSPSFQNNLEQSLKEDERKNKLSLMENRDTLRNIQDIIQKMEIMPHMLPPNIKNFEKKLSVLEKNNREHEEDLSDAISIGIKGLSPLSKIARKEHYEKCQEMIFNNENTLNFAEGEVKLFRTLLQKKKSIVEMRPSKFANFMKNKARSQGSNFNMKEFLIRYHKFWLTPLDQTSAYILHNEFKASDFKKPSAESRFIIMVLVVSALFHFLLFSISFTGFLEGILLRAGCFLVLLVLAFVYLFSRTARKIQFSTILFITYAIMMSLFSLLTTYLRKNEFIFQIELIFSYSLFTSMNSFNFIEALLLAILFLLNWVVCHFTFGYFDENFLDLAYGFIFLAFTVIRKYINFLLRIKMYNTSKQNMITKNQQNNLISHFLPAHILESFLVNPLLKNEFIDNFENVTILFADIAKFTSYSSKVAPSEVLSMLKLLFTDFDQSCLQHNIYKLYTIGDCYVAIGFIDPRDRNPAQEAKNMVLMAQTMIETIQGVQHKLKGSNVNMRIGIHTGQIFGGIVGTDIVRYDIYGPDVLIANKVESNGREGFINISKTTKELLQAKFPREFIFQKNKDFTVKSINKTVETYFVYKNSDE